MKIRQRYPEIGAVRLLEAGSAETAAVAIARLKATGLYDYVEPDFIVRAHTVPNDPAISTGDQWSILNTGQNGGVAGADIRAFTAWDTRTDASGVVVAVIDSGMRITHEDLTANVWRNSGEVPGNGRDDDFNGFVDDVNGINSTSLATALNNGNPVDVANHGTGVASIIGASGSNGLGLAGIAWRVQLMPLRFLADDGYGYVSDELVCFNYAITKKVNLINSSFGGAGFSQSILNALVRARNLGIIVVCAAGNESELNDVGAHYPSGYLIDNLIAVASTTRRDELSDFSNYGAGTVELAAPGSSIYLASSAGDQAYVTESGTSFSAPMVTGALALLKAQFPNDTYRGLINRLLRSTKSLPALAGKTATSGRLDLAAALTSTDNRPFNDDFATRSLLTGERLLARGASQLGTREPAEPAHAGVTGGASLWWSWTAPRTGTITLDTAGSEFDTALAVYTGANLSTLALVASNDDATASLTTSVTTFAVTAGTTYHFAVDGKAGANGLVVLHLQLIAANDAFASAAPFTGRSFSVTADNSSATREADEPKIKGKEGSRSLWYRWTAPISRRYYAATFSDEFDTMLGVYTGNSLSSLTEVAASTSAGEGGYTIVDAACAFTAVAGQTYWFSVSSEGTTFGAFKFSLVDSSWEFFGLGDLNTPAIGSDGVIYAVDYIGYLYAINPDGTRKWRAALTGYSTLSAPAVGSDGTVYVGDDLKYFYAYNPDGTRKWRYLATGVNTSSPAVAADGTIYARFSDNQLIAFTSTGEKKWSAPMVDAATYASPVIGPDGTIYCGAGDGKLHAFAADGSTKWAVSLGEFLYATPALNRDGTIYIGSTNKKFYALNSTGTVKWSYDTPDYVSSSAAIGLDGTIYFGCADNKFYALSATGELRWSFTAGDAILASSPLVAADGSIYFGCTDGLTYALNSDGSLRRTYATAGEVRASPILHNGRLYVASYDFRLYSIDIGQVPASSAWPMLRHNLRRTGRAEAQALSIGIAPTAQIAAAGGTATFTVGAVGTAPLSYQWRRNGVAIPGATEYSYTIDPVSLNATGQYSVTVTDSSGSITSSAAALAVSSTTTGGNAKLSNLAARARVGTGGEILIPGISISGSSPKQILIRAAGPALTPFGVTGVLQKPQLRLFKGATEIANNIGWADDAALKAAFTSVGAFNFGAGSTDCALLATVEPGGYTAQVSGVADTTGVALVEVYEVGNSETRLSNLSCLARVGTGGDILIPGITITGTGSRQFLIRAAGPALSAFGVGGVLATPRLELYSGSSKIAENVGWSTAGNATQTADAAKAVGAFAFTSGSNDCALFITLSAGSYTVQVSGVGDTTGMALVEVYEVP